MEEFKEYDEGVEETSSFTFSKVDVNRKTIGGFIYRLNEIDAQGDFVQEIEELQKASETWADRGYPMKIMHKGEIITGKLISVLENIIFTKDGEHRDVEVKKGDWWVLVKINTTTPMGADLFEKIESKTYKGFSMGGRSSSKNLDEAMKILKKRPRRLVSLDIFEISIVDNPANQISFKFIRKRNNEDSYNEEEWDMEKVDELIKETTGDLIQTYVNEKGYGFTVRNLAKIDSIVLSSTIETLTEAGILEDENNRFSETRKRLRDRRRKGRLSRDEKLEYLENLMQEIMSYYKN